MLVNKTDTRGELIKASEVLKPKGLAGEIKCKALPPVKKVFIDDHEYTVTRFYDYGGCTFLTLFGVADINAAECLRGKAIFISKADVRVATDEILSCDLVGFAVMGEDGRQIGTIRSMENYGGGDICDCDTFSFPYEDAFVIETNVGKRQMTVHDKMLGLDEPLSSFPSSPAKNSPARHKR
jgi:ribosomal 30S subunit maturation factor RimM